jgi:hypothetical protein
MPPIPSEAKMFEMLQLIATGRVGRDSIRPDILERLDALAESVEIKWNTPSWKIAEIRKKFEGII